MWRLRSSRLLSRVIGIQTRKGTKVDRGRGGGGGGGGGTRAGMK